MERDIIRKLRDALSGQITREADVVYILVLSRKLLEDVKPGQPYSTLKFYCHWALHVDLTGRGTTLPFLQQIDRFVDCLRADKDFGDQHTMFREFALFDTFRRELREFLSSHNLPTSISDDNDRWHTFLTLYAGVTEDGSLSCYAQPGDLNWISGVTFTKGRQVQGSYLPFDLVWEIHLLGDPPSTLKGNFRAFATPGGGEMLLHGFQLPPGFVGSKGAA